MSILLNRDTIDAMLEHANGIAQEHGIKLDGSDRSVKQLDNLLNNFHAAYEKEGTHDEEGLSGICLSLGIYIGDTIRNNLGNPEIFWYYGEPAAGGDQTTYLRYQDHELYPIDWIGKQILDGTEQSLYKKFKLQSKLLQETIRETE